MTYVDEYWQHSGRHLVGSQPERGDLGKSLPFVSTEALQVDQDLVHLLLVHLLQVFEPG